MALWPRIPDVIAAVRASRMPIAEIRGQARDLDAPHHKQNQEYEDNRAYQTTTDVHFCSSLAAIS
jgi:hypothetical protein